MLPGWMHIPLGEAERNRLRRHLRYPGSTAASSDFGDDASALAASRDFGDDASAPAASLTLEKRTTPDNPITDPERQSEHDSVQHYPYSTVRLVAPYEHTYQFRVKPREAGQSLISLLTTRFPFRSAQEWKQKIDTQMVLVNNQHARGDGILKPNDIVSHRNTGVTEPAIPDDFPILFENEQLVVLDKPAPVPVHAGGRYNQNTVISVLESMGYASLFVVHRLDAVTSGLLVLAKDPNSANQLKDKFINGLTKKMYEAVVFGVPREDSAVIRAAIRRKQGIAFECTDADDGMMAETRFEVLERGSGWARVRCFPVTGRTHQIRLHLREWGFPVWDDPLYGPHTCTRPSDLPVETPDQNPPSSGIPAKGAPQQKNDSDDGSPGLMSPMQNRPISLVSLDLQFR